MRRKPWLDTTYHPPIETMALRSLRRAASQQGVTLFARWECSACYSRLRATVKPERCSGCGRNDSYAVIN